MKIERLSILNYIASSILWLNALLVLLFNLLGLWDAWHLAGFIYLAYMLLPLGLSLAAYMTSKNIADAAIKKKYVHRNTVVMVISIVVTALYLFVFSTWFGL